MGFLTMLVSSSQTLRGAPQPAFWEGAMFPLHSTSDALLLVKCCF